MTREDLADLYRRFGPLVLNRCRRVLRDDAAAEDVLQDVFLRIWRYQDSFARADSKVAWLYRVADRRCNSDRSAALVVANDYAAAGYATLGIDELANAGRSRQRLQPLRAAGARRYRRSDSGWRHAVLL